MPLIQLDFPNPLNTSVQVGDVAYFSNPINYGTTGNPLSGDQWASTTTPHLTSNQSDIIKIGVITEIITWDGTVSSIICDMPQNLFNQYFAQIQAPVCITTPSIITVDPGSPGSGSCADHTLNYDVLPLNYITGGGTGADVYNETNVRRWFFDNPSVNFNDPSFHVTNPNVVDVGCAVDPNKPGFDNTQNNYWVAYSFMSMQSNDGLIPGGGPFVDINGNPIYIYDNSIPGFTTFIGGGGNVGMMPYEWHANDVVTGIPIATSGITGDPTNGHGNNYQAFFDWIDLNFPGVTNSSMTYDQYFAALEIYGVGEPTFGVAGVLQGTAPVVTITPGTTDCTGGGSFIMFSKDNKVNLSSVLGYYASVTLKNNSQEKIELFNVGADVFGSSK